MSNLLKKASIITTPTAYDNGRILSVKPNENIFGSEVITNGDFATDTDWIVGSTWTISGGSANCDGGTSNLDQASIVTNKKYKATVTVSNITTGTLAVRLGGSNVDVLSLTENGTYTGYGLSNGDVFRLRSQSGFDGSVDNVSVVEDLSGDFNFERGSAATRVNAQGLVENVQILSSELVQNGNFSEIGSEEVSNGDFRQEGSELVTGDNSNFNTSTGDWQQFRGVLSWDSSIQAGKWTDNGNSGSPKGFTMAGGFIPTSVGKIYRIKFIAKTNSSSSFNFGWIGETSTFNTVLNPNLTSDFQDYEFTFTTNGNNQRLYIALNNLTIGNGESYWIDNVSVKEVGQNWNLSSTFSIAENKLRCVSDGSYQFAYQNNVFTVGKTYKVTFDILDYVSGSIRVRPGGGAITSISANGSYTLYYTIASGGTQLFVERNSACDMSITNVSVKEVGQHWTLGTGWSVDQANSKATCDGTQTSTSTLQSARISNIQNDLVKLSFEIKDYSAGAVTVTLEGTGGVEFSNLAANGVYEINTTSSDSLPRLLFNANSSFVGSVTNISVVEVTDDTDLPRINYEGFSYQDVLGSELITNGDFAVDGSWVKGTGWTISGGSANGSSTTGDLYQENVVESGKYYKVTYTISNYVSGSVRVELPNNSHAGTERSANGTYTETILSGGTLVLFDARTSFTGSIDNVSVKEITGQEVVPNSGCGSWLFEPQSTNLVTYSEDISNAYWTKLGSSTTSGFTSPSGVGNAYKLVEDTSNGLHWMYSGGITVTNATTYNVSVFAKKGERNSIRIAEKSGISVIVNLESKDFDTISAGVINSNITELVDDWVRIDYSFQTTSTSEEVYIYAADNGNISYQGNGSSGIYVWGAQLEQLSYATSYIPTDGAASTRLQDIANNSGNSDLINSTEGVLYAEISALANDGTFREISLNDGTTTNVVEIRYTNINNAFEFIVRNANTVQVASSFTLTDATQFNKIAFSYKTDDYKMYVNGVEVASDTSGTMPSGLNKLSFNWGGFNPFFGNTKALAVFKEALTDAELQALTTI